MDLVQIRHQQNGGFAEVDELLAAMLTNYGPWERVGADPKPAPRARRSRSRAAGDTNTKE